MTRKQVGILLFEAVEVLDFCGPFEVFSVTRLNEDTRRQSSSPFNVFLIAETPGPIVASGGMRVLADHTLETCPLVDVLVIPGGWGTRAQMSNERLLRWLRSRATNLETLTSVCTGALLLGQAGLLKGRRATSHWQTLDWMQQLFPDTIVETQLHVVEDGNLVTSAGIAAGIDMALKVVGRYFGEAVAHATARHMEYPFPESSARRIEVA
jgi:transcriptional regulator GlxA family with amidase domain